MRPVLPLASVTVTALFDSTMPRVSSSVMVPVAVASPMSAPVAPLSVSVSVSFASSTWSPVTFTVTVFEVAPAAKLSVPLPAV